MNRLGASRPSVRDVTETDTRVGPSDAGPTPTARRPRRGAGPSGARTRSPLVVVGLVALLSVPLVVALGVMRQPRWYPTLDLAQTELRVRDVAGSHPPLVGLAGRIGTQRLRGSHPGPVSFWAMWPFYRAFGASSWALLAAATALVVVAVGLILWMVHRRGGSGLVLAAALVLAVLTRAYGASTLTQPWNPYLPLLWWVVFLVAVWSVVCSDLPMLPVAVLAGSFCLQTHISYSGLVPGLGLVAVVSVLLWVRGRPGDAPARRQAVRWGLIAFGVGVVLWVPPVIDQFTGAPGNLSIIWHHFNHPPDPPIGPHRGLELLLVSLNPFRLVPQFAHGWALTSSLRPGALFLTGWAATLVAARRLQHRALLRLHVVLAVALVLGAVSMSRIFGFVWFYLTLWAWGTTALMALAAGWTLSVLLVRSRRPRTRIALATSGRLAMGALVVVSTVLFADDAAYVAPPSDDLSRAVSAVAPPTVRALEAGSVPGGGRRGRYLVTWYDPVALGSEGYGLLLELERRGFHVGVLKRERAGATRHRVIDPAQATAVVRLSVGPDVEGLGTAPGARRVAYYDPRRPEQRRAYARLRVQVIGELRRTGRADLVPAVDTDLFGTSLDRRVPKFARDRMVLMLRLGLPTTVVVAPPSSG